MPNSKLDDKTGMPHRMSLGQVLNDIELAPAEISAFLAGLARDHLGGASDSLGRTLRDHSTMVADPATYGYKTPEAGAPAADQPYSPPDPTQFGYARQFGQTEREPSKTADRTEREVDPRQPATIGAPGSATPWPSTSNEPSPRPSGEPQPPPQPTQRDPNTGEQRGSVNVNPPANPPNVTAY